MNTTNTAQAEQELQRFIADAISLVGGVAELASIAQVSERTVYAWKNGERHPSRSKLNALTAHLESLAEDNWHTEIPRPKWKGVQQRLREPWQGNEEQQMLAEDFVFVSKAQAKPSAGGGSLETSDTQEGSYAFRLNWLLKRTPDTSRLRMMEVMGRSMEQTLHNGDLVLVNERDRELVEDRIYVLRVQDEIYVKRFSRAPGRYLFLGDNRELDFQDIIIDTSDEAANWEVIGRVIWAGKEF